MTAQSSAAYFGHVDIIRALFVHGADIDYDAFADAAEQNQLEVVREFLAREDLDVNHKT